MPDDELNVQTLLVEIPIDAYKLVLDYIYTNLYWDSDSLEKQEVVAALCEIEDAVREGRAVSN